MRENAIWRLDRTKVSAQMKFELDLESTASEPEMSSLVYFVSHKMKRVLLFLVFWLKIIYFN